MEKVKFDFEGEIVPAVQERARKAFSRHDPREREELTNDALSWAWQEAQRLPSDYPVRVLAYFACKRVILRYQFAESESSVHGPTRHKQSKPVRAPAPLELVATGRKDDPADVAALRVDFGEWLEKLSERDRKLIEDFFRGKLHKESARELGLVRSRIGQLREELLANWLRFSR